MGDDIHCWALFEREDREVSEHNTPVGEAEPVVEDAPELLQAFALLGLHWRDA